MTNTAFPLRVSDAQLLQSILEDRAAVRNLLQLARANPSMISYHAHWFHDTCINHVAGEAA